MYMFLSSNIANNIKAVICQIVHVKVKKILGKENLACLPNQRADRVQKISCSAQIMLTLMES